MTEGSRTWAVPGGRVPETSTGPEPENTSHDMLCFLNTGREDASISMWLYYEDRPPMGPYSIEVKAERVRHVRLNDLIDPEAIPMGTEYGVLVRSSTPIAVQYWRQDTSRGKVIATAMAMPLD